MTGSVPSHTHKWVMCLSGAVAAGMIALAAQSNEQLVSQTKRTTQVGATFTAPAAWSLRSEANLIVLTPPEPDSHLAIVDVKASDAAAAVSAAWSAYRPDFKRAVKLMTPVPARDAGRSASLSTTKLPQTSAR